MPNNDLNEVCSVSRQAQKLGLSRSRFYQLQKVGVFPLPVYCIRTRRPIYPQNLQMVCMDIRKRGIGCNGQPVIFYSARDSEKEKPCRNSDVAHKKIAVALKNMGIKATTTEIRKAINTLDTKGVAPDSLDGAILGKLFNYFNQERQNGV